MVVNGAAQEMKIVRLRVHNSQCLSTKGLLRSESGFASRLGRLAEPEDEADSSNGNCLCFKLIAEPVFLSGILTPDCHHFKF